MTWCLVTYEVSVFLPCRTGRQGNHSAAIASSWPAHPIAHILNHMYKQAYGFDPSLLKGIHVQKSVQFACPMEGNRSTAMLGALGGCIWLNAKISMLHADAMFNLLV